MKLHLLYVCFYLFCVSDAQVSFSGRCPTVSTKNPFSVSSYSGVWYEYARYFALYELGQKCAIANYVANTDGSIGVTNTAKYTLTGKDTSITGTAVSQSTSEPAKLKLALRIGTFFVVNSPYWVLDTDYETYSVVWTCNDYWFYNKQVLYILTRSRNPAQSIIDVANGVIDKNGLNRDKLGFTDQTNC